MNHDHPSHLSRVNGEFFILPYRQVLPFGLSATQNEFAKNPQEFGPCIKIHVFLGGGFQLKRFNSCLKPFLDILVLKEKSGTKYFEKKTWIFLSSQVENIHQKFVLSTSISYYITDHIIIYNQNASINANNKIIPKIITPTEISHPSDTQYNPQPYTTPPPP